MLPHTDEPLYTFKVLVIGDSGVGKSNLITRFTRDQLTLENTTIGVQLDTCTVEIRGKNVKVNIWDTAGQERYRSSTSLNYRNAVGALLVYDICNRNSFANTEHWLRELRMFADENVMIVLVGNRCDLEESRVVSQEEGKSFAEHNGLLFSETSALKSTNVRQVFNGLISDIYKRFTIGDDSTSGSDRRHSIARSPSVKIATSPTRRNPPPAGDCC